MAPNVVLSEDAAGVILRPGGVEDLGAVCTLLRTNSLPTDGVESCIDNFVVAEADSSIMGAAALETYGEYSLLRSVAVSSDLRSKGVGRALVARLLNDSRSNGTHAVYLLTTTAESWFASVGFVRVDRASVPGQLLQSEEFKGACPDSATVMRLDLRSYLPGNS